MALDELTRLHDRKDLFAYLKQEINRSQRTNRPFCLMIIDVDRFKEINDTYGHLRGDLVLMEVAEIIRKSCRDMDIPCRYGGDEFVLILPEADRSIGIMVAERILHTLKRYIFRGGENQPDLSLTVSIGIAEWTQGINTAEAIIARADQALYLAKKSGRARMAKDTDIDEKIQAAELNFNEFVDRDNELAELKKILNDAADGHGSLAIISGEAGIGKTRLLNEIVSTCKIQNIIKLYARPFDYGITPPYYVFFQAIRPIIERCESSFISILLPAYRSQLARFLPDLSTKLVAEDAVPLSSPDHEKIRLFNAILKVLELIADRHLVFLVLDDMQWARETDLELLGYLARNIRKIRLLICLAYRREEVDDKHPLSRFLQALSRDKLYRLMELKGFSEPDILKKLSSIFKTPIPLEITRLITKVTQGNPLYIEEYTKVLMDKGHICREDDHWAFKTASDISVPSSINDLLTRRFEGLNEETVELLTIAAAVEGKFSLTLLQEITKKNEGHLLHMLDQGIHHHTIEEEKDDAFSFTNYFIARILYDKTAAGRRRHLHRQIADALAVVNKNRLSEIYENLTHHYQRAEDWKKCFEYGLKTGDKLTGLYAFNEAIKYFSQCQVLINEGKISDPAAEIDVLMKLGRLNVLTANFDGAMKYLTQALMKKEITPKQRAEITVYQCEMLEKKGYFERAIKTYESALKHLDPIADQTDSAWLNSRMMWAYRELGEYSKVAAIAETTMPILQKAGKEREFYEIHNILGCMHLDKNELDLAEFYFRKCDDYWKTKAYLPVPESLNNLAIVYANRGEYEKALELFLRFLEINNQIGDGYQICLSHQNIGTLYDETGEWKKAIHHLKKSCDIAQGLNAMSLLVTSYYTLGILLYATGDIASAQDYLLGALEVAEKIGQVRFITKAKIALSTISLHAKDFDRAGEYCRQALDLSKKNSIIDVHCDALIAQGEIANCLKMFDDALRYADDAVHLSKKNNYQKGEMKGYRLTGEILINLDKYEEAKEKLDKAVGMIKTQENSFDLAVCQNLIGVIHARLGDKKTAFEYLSSAKAICEKLEAQSLLQQVEAELAMLG